MVKTSIRRINFHAGPGASKSTTTALIFAKLKQLTVLGNSNINVEQVQEYVKNWAYEGRKVTDWVQVYAFGKQLYREYIPLSNGVDIIVTDSPLILSCAYAKKYQSPGWQNLIEISKEFDKSFPSLNIFLRRGNRPYVQTGRFQNEEKAREMDDEIEKILSDTGIPYFDVSYEQPDLIFSLIVRELGLSSHIIPK